MSGGLGTQRIADASRLDCAGAENELRAERRLVHEAVVDDSVDAGVIENTGAAAQAGLAVAEDVVGKTHARREIVQTGIHAVGRDARIAGEVRSRRSVGELGGTGPGNQTVDAELLHPAFQFAPGQSRFIAQSQVDGQAASDPDVVLGIHAGKNVAIVLEFSRTLAEGEVAAVVPQRARQEGVDPVKAELRRLEEQIVEIHTAAFDDSAKAEIVPAFHPADVIAPGEIVPDEGGIGIVAEVEIAVDADLLNCVGGRLKGNIRAQVLHAGHIRRGTAAGSFTRITEAKIVQQRRPENMVLVDQIVLIGDGRLHRRRPGNSKGRKPRPAETGCSCSGPRAGRFA